MRLLLRDQAELSRLLLEDPEAGRCEVSERLFAELKALRELNERKELENARRALEEKDRQKDQFIAVLAHELRNPLGAIRAATDSLGLMNLNDPKIERFRVLLDRQSAAMARMLDDLLDASRIAFGKVSVEMVDVDFKEVVRNTVEESIQRIREAGLTLDCELPKTPCHVLGDRIRLRQVLDNLLSNSIKFTPAPGRIAVRLRAEPGSIVLRVEDTGRGFDATWAERLFQPFVQEEQDLSHREGGLGLGLAISSRLAALHGGELSATSPGPGGGSTFTLTLPLAAAEAPAVHAAELVRRDERLQVLLVEDNTEVADTLAEMLGLAGFQVEVTYDGPSALARAAATVPEIIVCDLGLPAGMDGYAVARACRADPVLRDTRLIAASGYSRPEDHAKAKHAGFDVLVGKPIGLKRLEEVLREILPKR